MKVKSDFWKIMEFIDSHCDIDTLRWFEGLGFYYGMFHDEIDEWIEAFKFFDIKEE